MKSFRYNTQTCVYYGRNSIKEHENIFCDYGTSAVAVSSKFVKGCKNYAKDDVVEVFEKYGIDYRILEDVVEDPPVENIVAMYEKLDGFIPDYVVGIGGGAALDAAKALAMLIKNQGKDPYKVFYGPGAPMNNFKNICDIPVFAVPTTAGTGSEVTGGAVLTRADKNTKEAMYMWYYPEVSFVDPR
ncbi:MAG: iron-containing alcohol dehydrogenase, partial [Lachnospiraceae bacterium]|nr:iron-containing alcohol dehydrogenase [Lachnospiraceae bacterium]